MQRRGVKLPVSSLVSQAWAVSWIPKPLGPTTRQPSTIEMGELSSREGEGGRYPKSLPAQVRKLSLWPTARTPRHPRTCRPPSSQRSRAPRRARPDHATEGSRRIPRPGAPPWGRANARDDKVTMRATSSGNDSRAFLLLLVLTGDHMATCQPFWRGEAKNRYPPALAALERGHSLTPGTGLPVTTTARSPQAVALPREHQRLRG